MTSATTEQPAISRLYIYLTYITQHIWQLHYIYRLHSHCAIVYTSQLCIYMHKHNQVQYLLHMFLPNMFQKQNIHTKIGHICHTWEASDRFIWKMYTYKCFTYEVKAINHVKRSTVDIQYVSLNKYGPLITNIVHAANVLNGHIDPTVLHINAKINPNCNSYFTHYCHIHARNKYVYQTRHMCLIFDGSTWGYVCAPMYHIWSHWHQPFDW